MRIIHCLVCVACYFLSTESTGCELLVNPFPCCIMPNFINSEPGGYLEKLKCELLRLKFHEKNNDLYQFHQVNNRNSYSMVNISYIF